MVPNRKALAGDWFSMPLKSGIRENHARNDRSPGGKDAVNITPDKKASRTRRV